MFADVRKHNVNSLQTVNNDVSWMLYMYNILPDKYSNVQTPLNKLGKCKFGTPSTKVVSLILQHASVVYYHAVNSRGHLIMLWFMLNIQCI